MKRLLAAIALLAFSLTPTFADTIVIRPMSQPPRVIIINPQPRVIVMDPCASLSGTTRMCVHNNSDYRIQQIQSSDSQYGNGYHWGRLSWGGAVYIAPHSTAVVNFGDHSHACVFFIQITTTDNRTHVYGNVNVCRNNNIAVSNF